MAGEVKYAGYREADGTCGVFVQYPDGHEEPLQLGLEVVNHSPTGFEWGYGGSGPARLALALVLHAYRSGVREAQEKTEGHFPPFPPEQWKPHRDKLAKEAEARARLVYQQFKAMVVSQWPREAPWEITRARVRELARHIMEERSRRC